VAVIDADVRDTQDRVRDFDSACSDQGQRPRQADDLVLFVIPKRNIETWLAYLRGEGVDESTAYARYARESECQPNVERLDEMCRRGNLEGVPPASLQSCCTDFGTFWNLIQAG
jgi:hypothetical protein